MKRLNRLALVTVTVGLLSGCGGQQPSETAPETGTQQQKKVGFDLAGMDNSVKPQDDFYQYAIGQWRKDNPIPDDQNRWAAFTMLREQTRENVKTTILNAAKVEGAAAGSVEYKVGTFYKIAMDEAKIEADGLSPIKAELARIDAIKNLDDFNRELAHMIMYTANPLFYFYVAPDDKNTSMNIANVYQGGIGLPDRDFYVEEDDRSKEIRVKYVEHLTNMFKLLGSSEVQAKAEADSVMAIETRIAKSSNTRTENRNPTALYNKLSLDELKALAPKLDWKIIFTEMNVADPGAVNINQPKCIEEIGKMMTEVSIDDWKVYLKWNLIRGMASTLSNDVVNERFEFANKFMNGQKIIQPRWKRVVDMTNRSLGEAVGQLYVKEFFPPEAKELANEIVDNLLVAMGERIDGLVWMSATTKVKAREKLATFSAKIGYPDKWEDLSELEIKDDSYAQNVMRASYFEFKDDAKKINKPVDKAEWFMPPQTVNAFYNPSLNDITFPAGILQFPFFDKDVDDAINYGAMGAVIGHEVTHGFDDQGRQYDKDGNLNDWWTKEDAQKFEARTKLLIEQYNVYSPFEGFNVNGQMTLGENIADLGGLTVAYQAFSKTEQFKAGEKIDGFTPEQRFFLSWAQVWKTNIRDKALKTNLKTDVHSPASYRVVGPLSNITPFFEAFDVKPSDPMRNDQSKIVEIW